ncbi:MAG: arsenite methyltransferase [Bernardetiaceae bacterium]
MPDLKEKIKAVYAGVLQTSDASTACCAPSGNCCDTNTALAGFGEDYSHLPGYTPEADYGLGCGIPVAFADIVPGQTVLDLGSGAGNDAFVARSLVGEGGQVIGVDMTPEMIAKAKANQDKLGYTNVSFVLGEIENMPLADALVDVVISNCVLNLVTDKLSAYREIHRVLKPGGHFCISDVVVSGELTEKMKNAAELYAGCIAGAMLKTDYLETIQQAGFAHLEVKKEKVIELPDTFLSQHLNPDELTEFRQSGVKVLSLTITGKRS